MEIGEIKYSNKIGKLKDNNEYILDIMGDNFQYSLLKMFWLMKKTMKNITQKHCY